MVWHYNYSSNKTKFPQFFDYSDFSEDRQFIWVSNVISLQFLISGSSSSHGFSCAFVGLKTGDTMVMKLQIGLNKAKQHIISNSIQFGKKTIPCYEFC